VSLSETSASHLYRIAQEALTNTARHGHPATVSIFLLVTTRRFLLQISDDGIGIGDSSRSALGMGLKIMKYRAGMIGARFEIVPNQPRGTVVRITGEQPMVMSALHCAHAI
jgi:two-component system sensor kinase FixL